MYNIIKYYNNAFTVKNETLLSLHIISMALPIRCNTCGKTIGHLWETFFNEINKDEDGNELTVKNDIFLTKDQLDKTTITEAIFKEIGIKKYCCKRMLLSSINTTDVCG